MIEITPSFIFMIIGFLLSLYACVSNDAIQTLGTFLNTTKERPVWQIWLYVSAVMVITFVAGWIVNDGDMAFGRLDRIPHAQVFYWWHVLPPLVLLYLTRKGIPVATAFLIISVFSSSTVIGLMVAKSFIGYVCALIASLILYFIIARSVEKIFLYMKNKPISKGWVVAKWLSTAFLWSAWLLQDGAVLYVYLPRKLTLCQMILSLAVFMSLLLILCYKRGGEIQNIVKLKTNTQDVRSATKLKTPRKINGVNFDGTADITIEDDTKIPLSQKGVAGGVAELNESGLIPSAQLPSYVDDTIEGTLATFPEIGESGKIYVDTSTNLTYRWSGS